MIFNVNVFFFFINFEMGVNLEFFEDKVGEFKEFIEFDLVIMFVVEIKGCFEMVVIFFD